MKLLKSLKSKPHFCHRGPHGAAHRWEPCKIGGLSKYLDLIMCAVTRWFGRPGMASCASEGSWE